ncbi:hypothetical protein MTP99_011675 [Tenebrio molitor]|nr:hypothetical protein MTP99_011675 [Tenebrio molitor]
MFKRCPCLHFGRAVKPNAARAVKHVAAEMRRSRLRTPPLSHALTFPEQNSLLTILHRNCCYRTSTLDTPALHDAVFPTRPTLITARTFLFEIANKNRHGMT